MHVETKKRVWGGIAVTVLAVSVPLTAFGLYWFHGLWPPPQETCSLPEPVLTASAGDSEVTLRWEWANGQRATVKEWQYRQAVQGEGWSVSRSTGPGAAYVVPRLTNSLAYTFQVRAELKSGYSCWSTAVAAVPRRITDVMEQIEEHQEAIAGSMADVVERMDERQELLQELGEEGIATLGAIAASTSEIAKHSDGIRRGVSEVADKVETAGKNVATATNAVAHRAAEIRNKVEDVAGKVEAAGGKVAGATTVVAQRAAEIRDEVGEVAGKVAEVATNVDAAAQKVADRLDEIKAQLEGMCDGCQGLPDNCRLVGTAYFENNSDVINRLTWCGDFPPQEDGLFVNTGYATSAGYAVHNLHLSDRRTACVSRCLHEQGGKFTFMEIARGEVRDLADPEGKSHESKKHRRVDVTFCPDFPSPEPIAEKRVGWPDGCGCDALTLEKLDLNDDVCQLQPSHDVEASIPTRNPPQRFSSQWPRAIQRG